MASRIAAAKTSSRMGRNPQPCLSAGKAMSNFDDWSRKRFLRWLHKNYPKPESRWVEITINVNGGSGLIEKTTMADDYETCMHELAFDELALHHREKGVPQNFKAEFPKPECTFLIGPAKRRKKKQMWLRTSGH
jgi:hypothetical protein